MTSQLDLHTVLVRLLRLEGEDAQLPSLILVNLHRAQLRVPLEALIARAVAKWIGDENADEFYATDTTATAWSAVESRLKDTYPGVRGGAIFDQSKTVRDLPVSFTAVGLEDGCPELATQGAIVEALFSRHEEDWYAHDAVVNLHRLTWQQDPAYRAEILELLAVELALDDDVGRMILDLAAATSRPVQSE